MHFLQKCYQNLVRNVRHCNKFAKCAILVQTCKILARNAKLTRISEEFCKICDSCNLGSNKCDRNKIPTYFNKVSAYDSSQLKNFWNENILNADIVNHFEQKRFIKSEF